MLGVGYLVAALAGAYWQFVLAQALLIGMLGSSATFGPLVADVSHWFLRQRGIAVAIVASGNYLAGTIWPPILQHAIHAVGWRHAYIGIGVFCLVTMLPLALLLRARGRSTTASARAGGTHRSADVPLRAPPLVARPASGPAGARRRRLLRRHVDAAGAPRRLLRRSRLRACPRRRDARRSCWAWAWSAGWPRASSPTASAASAR